MRVAAIDIGTNSVLLLVAEERDGALVPVVERATVTRLGQKVDASGALAAGAVARTLACLERYAEEMRAAGVVRVDAVGTSAMRDASNGAEFVERARALLGVAPRVITGDEEAALTFAGALSGLSLGTSPAVVFDIGGGSTEIIAGDAAGQIRHAVSLQVGSVRLAERHLRSDPPAEGELAAIRADARAALEEAVFARAPAAWALGAGAPVVVGVAGTVTTLAAVARAIAPYEGARVHGLRVARGELLGTTMMLAALPLARRREVPGLDPARADVIVAGGLIVDELMAWVGSATGELVVSDRGVRWGLVQRLA